LSSPKFGWRILPLNTAGMHFSSRNTAPRSLSSSNGQAFEMRLYRFIAGEEMVAETGMPIK
jgi:hypothetical protein